MSQNRYNDSYVEAVPRLQFGFEDAACALGLPLSTLEKIHRSGDGPTFFKIGRRMFTTIELMRSWQQEQIAKIDAA